MTMTRPTVTQLLKYFLYLGSLGFGGPVALVGYMQRDLVEQRKWFTREEYMKSLALSQLAPGPLAAQLAICLGYVHSRVRGATAVALAFVLPSFVMTVAISWLYVRFGGLAWMQAAFYGVGAAVIGIITIAAYKLARLTMAKDGLQWVIFALMGVVTAWSESEILWLFLLSGVIAMVAQVPPAWLKRPASACLMVAVTPDLLLQILWFFAKAGAFVFGSGLAIVPFLHAGVVQEYGWLNDKQFLDAVAVAMLTFWLYWSDFIDPLLYLKSQSLYTLPIGVRQLQQLNRTNWPLLMAAAVVATVPAVLVFLAAQRYLLNEGRRPE